jgi:hypothetical protein
MAQPSESAFIMLVSDTPLAGQTFAELPIQGDNVARLVARACEKFGWGAPTQCRLYWVPEGRDRALAVEDDPLSAAGILVSANKLFADEAVVAGSWLLARVPHPFSPSPLATTTTTTTTPVPEIASLLVTVMLRALRLEAARPSVDVRLWSRPGVLSAKLDEDFDIFKSGVAAAARVSAASARLYFFRGAVVLDKRVPLNDSAALRDFAASGVAVWVFEGTASPAAAASAGGGYTLDFTDQGEGGGVDFTDQGDSDASELG